MRGRERGGVGGGGGDALWVPGPFQLVLEEHVVGA